MNNLPIKLGGKDHSQLFTETYQVKKEASGKKKVTVRSHAGDVIQTKVNRLKHLVTEFCKSAVKGKWKWEWVNNKNQLKLLNQSISTLTPEIEILKNEQQTEAESKLLDYVDLLTQVDEVVKLLERTNANKNKTQEIRQSFTSLAKTILDTGKNLQKTKVLEKKLAGLSALLPNTSPSVKGEREVGNPYAVAVIPQAVLPSKSREVIVPDSLLTSLSNQSLQLTIKDPLLKKLILDNFGEKALQQAENTFSDDQPFLFEKQQDLSIKGQESYIKVTCPLLQEGDQPAVFYLDLTPPKIEFRSQELIESYHSEIPPPEMPFTAPRLSFEGPALENLGNTQASVMITPSLPEPSSNPVAEPSTKESLGQFSPIVEEEISDHSPPQEITSSTNRESGGKKSRTGWLGFFTFLLGGLAIAKGSNIFDSMMKTAEIAQNVSFKPVIDGTTSDNSAAPFIDPTLPESAHQNALPQSPDSLSAPSTTLENTAGNEGGQNDLNPIYALGALTAAGITVFSSGEKEKVNNEKKPLSKQQLTAKASEFIFGLVNLGSAGVKAVLDDAAEDKQTLIFKFTISILEEMLNEGLIPDDEVEETKKLLNDYKLGLDIAKQYAILRSDPATSKEAVMAEKKRIQSDILSKLKTENEIFIPTGYVAKPSGHVIGLRLKIVDVNGVSHIQGEVINRGTGVEYHGKSLAHGIKEQYASILTLSSVPLADLEKSQFLNCLTELNIQNAAFRENPLVGGEFSDSIQYGISDFYEIALEEWPGEIVQAGQPQIARGAQRGDTCILKTFLTPIKNTCSPTTAHHIKLRMRIKSLQFLLANASLEEYSISHLEWSLAKLNRSLKKLIEQGIATEEEKETCLSLSQQMSKKIESIKKQTILKKGDPTLSALDLKGNVDYSITITPPPKLSGKPDLSIPTLKYPEKEAFLHIEQSVSLLKKIGKFDVFSWDSNRNAKQYVEEETVSRLSLEFLESLPTASDPSWLTTPELTSKNIYHLQEICKLLVDTSTTRRGLKNPDDHTAGAYTTLSGRQITAIVNAYAGILLRSKELVSKELLGQQAATILKLLDDVGPQIRVKNPKDLEKLDRAKEILKGLNPETIPPKDLKLENSFENTEYRTLEDIHKDPIANHIYQSLIKNGKMDQITDYGDCPRFTTPIEATVYIMGNMKLFYYNGAGEKIDNAAVLALSDPYLDMTFFHLLNPLILGLGARFNFNQYPYFGYSSAIGMQNYNGIPTLKKEIRHQETYKGGGEGVLCHAYFPWTREETTLISLLLDSRSPSREHENKQLLTSKNRSFCLGTETIPPEEMGKLLSITTYEETLVPQCIRYFEQHFLRLKDPNFQALLEAFLWTGSSNGKSVLQNVMMEKNNHVAEQLINFLEVGLQNAHEFQFLETELALTRILAQVCEFSRDAPFDRYERVKGLLSESMNRIKNLLEREGMTPDSKTKILHWLVALYPYIESNPILIKICKEANDQLNLSGLNYLFDHRRIVQEDFEAGWVALTTKIEETSPNHLPWFVTRSSEYPFSNINPVVIQTDDNTYEFEVNGTPTKIIVSEKAFQTHQFLDSGDGTKRWFVFTSSSSFPSLNLTTSEHPCRGSSESLGYFLKGTRLWVSVKAPFEAILTSQKDHRVICLITKNKIIKADEPDLELANIYKSENPFFKNLFTLDDKQNILAWQTRDSHVKAFDFPNYDLRIELKDGKWQSSKHPGFYVDTSKVVMELEPHQHYLVLKNDQGKQLVLMPNRQIELTPTELRQKSSVLKPSIAPSLLEFSIDKAGKLVIPDDHAKLLYLIHIALRSLDYLQARKLINKLSIHPTDWTGKEEEIYQWMEVPEAYEKSPEMKQKITDKHPYASALRCKMRLIALKSEATNVRLAELERDYLICLEQMNSLGPEWLTEEEENEILSMLESSNTNPIFLARKNELNKLPSETLVVTSPKTNPDKKISIPQFSEECQNQMLAQTVLAPIALNLRPGADFVLNFYLYYQIAYFKKPPDQLEELKTLLRLSRNAPEESHKCLHTILSDMVNDSPQVKWPKPEDIKDSLQRGHLENTVRSALTKSKIEEFASLIPSEPSFQDKLKVSPDFTNNISPNKGIRLEHPAKVRGASPVPFAVTLKENSELIGLNKFFDRKNPQKQIEDLEADILKLTELLDDAYQIPQNADPCTVTSFERTRDGIKEKIEQLQGKIAILNALGYESYCLPTYNSHTEEAFKKVEELSQNMTGIISRSSEKLKISEAKILKMLHHYPEDLQRLVYGGIIKPMELQELIVCFGRQNDERILQSNPSLEGKLRVLKGMIAEYLVDLTEHNQLVKAKDLLNDTISITSSQGLESTAARNLADKFMDTLMAKQAYRPRDPKLSVYLVFEAFSGLRLREDQIAALEKLTTGTGLVDFEIEARTGFGKSQVLIPLWLFLTSRHDRLTMMTVPTALLSDQSLHLQKMLGNAFSIGVQKIKFNRNRSKDVEYLRKISRQLEEAKSKKRVLLIDIKSLHGLCGLAHKQALIEKDDPNVTNELLALRISIQTNLSNFIDESRDCLSVRQRYDYSIGDPVAVTLDQCEQVGNFFEKFIISDAILNKWNFEFLPGFYDPKKLTLTEANVHLLQEDIADLILEDQNINKDLRAHLKTHLLGGLADNQAKDFIDSLSLDQRRHYAWLKVQLTSTLSRTCLRVCGTDYDLLEKEDVEGNQGTEHEEGFTVPCLRGTPKPTSEFTNLDDRMISTVQANLKREFSQGRVERFINSLKELEIINEGDIVKHPLYQLFVKINKRMGISKNLIDMTSEDIEEMAKFLNGNQAKELRLEFITKVILTKISFYKHKISGTSFNLIRSQHHIQAASGTVDPDTLPPRMKPIASLSAPIGNLLAVYKNSSLKVVKNQKPQEILNELLDKDLGHRVIVDGAGYFRDLSQKVIIETLLTKTIGWAPPVKGVTYFDEEGRCMILERGATKPVLRENSLLSTEETYIFIRQSKAVGSDIAMPATAKSFVTFGKDTKESFLWQAWGRKRGLETGQSLDIVSTQEDTNVIANAMGVKDIDLKISHIFQYAKKIEAKGKDYFFSLRLYLEDRIEGLLWRHLNDPMSFAQVFAKIEPLLIDNTENDPLKSLYSSHKPIPVKDAIVLLQNSVLGPLKALGHAEFEDDIKKIETDFSKHVNFKKLPFDIAMADCVAEEAEMEVEDEVTEETEEELEQEQEQEQEQTVEFGTFTFKPTKPLEWNGDYAFVFNEKSQASVFGIPVHFSPNFSVLENGRDLHSKIRKRAFQFIVKVDEKGEVKLCPLDLHDSRAALIYMSSTKKPDTEQSDYYIISGKNTIASSQNDKTDLSKVLRKDWIKISIICKIFSGDKTLSSMQREWLQKNPKELDEAIAMARDYLSVWPHLLPLTRQLEKLKKDPGTALSFNFLDMEIKSK